MWRDNLHKKTDKNIFFKFIVYAKHFIIFKVEFNYFTKTIEKYVLL